MGVCVWAWFCNAVLSLLSCFAISKLKKIVTVALLKLCFICCASVIALCLFFTEPWIGLWAVIVAFPDHTDLVLFNRINFVTYTFMKVKCFRLLTFQH